MRQIIVSKLTTIQNYITIDYIFWFTTPAAQVGFIANPNATSQAPNISQQELSSIQSGNIIEQPGEMSFAQGSSIPSIQAALIAAYNAAQAVINNAKTFQFYGTSWDGTTWTVLGG